MLDQPMNVPQTDPNPTKPKKKGGRVSGKLIQKRVDELPLSGDDAATLNLPTRDGEPPGDETRKAFFLSLSRKKEMVVPKTLGPYTIEGEIARGGMGIVLKGYHTQLHRNVAIKLLRPEVSDDQGSLDRFMREARATAKLRHPGIVQIHDVTTDATGRTYLVMDFVEGQSLKHVLKKGPIPPQRAALILQKVSAAVAHAHEHGILHRDLKPDNVLIDSETREPLLTDFGLAKVLRTDNDSQQLRSLVADSGLRRKDQTKRKGDSDARVDLTLEGEVIGTPLYMAPEQIDDEIAQVGPGTDIWALGAVLFECLTGKPPFPGRSIFDIFDSVIHDKPPAPRTVNSLIPTALEAIALKCLNKKPIKRFATAQALAQELERFLTPLEPITRRDSTPPSVSSGRPGLVLAACVVAVATGYFTLGPGKKYLENDPSGAQSDSTAPEKTGPEKTPETRTQRGKTSRPQKTTHRRANPRIPGDVATGARKGDPQAMALYGFKIMRGEEAGSKDEGLDYLHKAAQAGNVDAYRALGMVYRDGHGVTIDNRKAIEWLKKGSEKGAQDCTLHAAALLCQSGAKADKREARELLEGIAESPDVNPRVLLLLGRLLAESPEYAQQSRAIRLWRRAAEQEFVPAMLQLAEAHHVGRGVSRNPAKGLTWLEKAAETEDPGALFAMGHAHERGKMGLERSIDEAIHYYNRAAAAGHPSAGALVRALEERKSSPKD